MYLTRIAGIETITMITIDHFLVEMYLTRIAGIETARHQTVLPSHRMYLTRIAGIETSSTVA